MNFNERPKRALIAYCVLADRLRTPGVGILKALMPFVAEACREYAGEMFDAEKFSNAVSARFGIRIPRLAALGLTDQLTQEGLLTVVSGYATSVTHRYAQNVSNLEIAETSPITEAEIDAVLANFVSHCRTDEKLANQTEIFLHEAFLDRLLNIDSMRILGRKEASVAIKKNVNTLSLKTDDHPAQLPDRVELHLDFVVSQFLLDLRSTNEAGFERVSDIAFANMAAEAVACFRDPPAKDSPIVDLTVYLDSPLLLDALGVNSEYAQYGCELIEMIKESGATPAVFDHCVDEAESVIHARLSSLRSGINKVANRISVNGSADLLSVLVGNVAIRAEARLGIAVHRDPEAHLHRRNPETVGTIETNMNDRMKNWLSSEAKEYDRKSVWSMLAIRDTSQPKMRICESVSLLLSRNTILVEIANSAWRTWLKGSNKHSRHHIENWTPVSMSDKQFAGYLWMRSGDTGESISRSRLLAHCSAAVRPRADIKAKTYNLLVELNGQGAADDFAALMEDREAAKALMRTTRGDPEDVTSERLPYILDRVMMEAGEHAAAKVRAEGKKQLDEALESHELEITRIHLESAKAQKIQEDQAQSAKNDLIQQKLETDNLCLQNEKLKKAAEEVLVRDRQLHFEILSQGLMAGNKWYKKGRLICAGLFGLLTILVGYISNSSPLVSWLFGGVLSCFGFWFMPTMLNRPLNFLALKRLTRVVNMRDPKLTIPNPPPNFELGSWPALLAIKLPTQ